MADRPTTAHVACLSRTAATGPLHWEWQAFAALRNEALYAALALRAAVFVVEQECAFLDLDGHDLHAYHLLGWSRPDAGNERTLIAYLRVLPPGTRHAEASIGRVITAASHRGSGLGRALMMEGLERTRTLHPGVAIRIGAQARLQAFYQSLGFVQASRTYLEDGIPHVEMLLPGEPSPESRRTHVAD